MINHIRYPKKSIASSLRGALTHTAALEAYKTNPVRCLGCRQAILPKLYESPGNVKRRRFCGHSCAAATNNRKYPKRKPEGECDVCSKTIRTTLKYCSKVCKAVATNQRRKIATKTNSKYVIAWRQEVKLRAVALKGGKCCICGYSKSIRALHFHHVDPTTKKFTLSHGIHAWATVLAELEKCILVCSNCHGEIHDGLLNIQTFLDGRSDEALSC